MNQEKIPRLLTLAVFVFSSVLRLGLAVVNREAFDDHMQVIALILQNNRLPETTDCSECFQPKLFYFTAATAIQIAHIDIAHPHSLILATQIMNFFVGEIILIIAFLLIIRLRARYDKVGLIAFALLAFNPALIGINGMPSNDTFAILFSTVAIYLFWMFLQKNRLVYLLLAAILTAIGIATKTNIWCTALAIFITLLIRGISNKHLRDVFIAMVFLPGIFIATLLNPLSQYFGNFQKYGTPVTLNVAREPLPSFFEKTYVRRPGIVSIQDGLFTFKLIDLLEYPRLTLGTTDYPAHRTSLWTDIYASANSLHFYNSPDSWHTKPDFEVTRSIYILALLPTALFLFGIVSGWIYLLRGVFERSNSILIDRYYGLFDVVLVGYIIFIVILALQYRDFSTMKAIYIYPSILAMVVLFLRTTEAYYISLLERSKWMAIPFYVLIVFLVIMYAMDVSQMIIHLYDLNIR